MRTRPDGFIGDLRIQWVCAAVHAFLGECTLANVPALLSGFGSAIDRPRLGSFAAAAFALRQLGVSVGSNIQLRQAVHDAVIWEEDSRRQPDFVEPPFSIDPEDPAYPFVLRAGAAIESRRMANALVDGLPYAPWTIPGADPARPMAILEAAADGAERIPVDLSALPPPPAPGRHNVTVQPRGPIVIPVADLEQVAHRLDAADLAAPGRARGNWLGRLREANGQRKFEILVPDRGRGTLQDTGVIRLEGLKHLIGLPGTGKTTLIVLLLMWLDEHGYRTAVLLPSIEMSLNMLGDLRFYGADAGLLVGQSPETRISHAQKLAERLGADESRGFGRTVEGADLLGLTCALAAFDTDPEGHDAFPHLTPPCNQVLQRRIRKDGTPAQRETKQLCPLSGACGRMKAPRELTHRRVWLGHVLSMDTRISPHFAEEQMRYFEAVAMASDLVIVDEADGAQAALDRKAISSLDLTGSEESYEHHLVQDLFSPMAAGRNDMTAGNLQNYSAAASDFTKLNRALVNMLQEDRQRNGIEGAVARFKDTFVTGNNVLTALFCPPDITVLPPAERLAEERRFNAIRAFWDGCIRAALYRRTDADATTDEYEFDRDRVAQDTGRTPQEIDETGRLIAEKARDWISEPLPTRRMRYMEELRAATFALIEPQPHIGPAERVELFQFLVGVTTVIFQFLALVPAQQAMVAEGIHREPLFRQGISDDLAHSVPEALLGRLSGLRFHYDETDARSTVRLQYVTFRGAPRVLLYRLHHLMRHEGRGRGPAVLLASATSFLAESPTFHIPSGPDLVLRRDDDTAAWRNSRYLFAPIPNPEDPARPMRFSGAPLGQRDRILRAMVDHYASGDTPLLERMARDFDAGRKTGLVVNSYAQVRLIKDWLRRRYPDVSDRVIAVIDKIPDRNDGDWITASQVERIGLRDDWCALVFPMKALSRGVNIVFERGPRRRDALLGTIVFMTRPHPSTESLDLVAGLAGSATLAFDTHAFPADATSGQVTTAWIQARTDLTRTARRLLRFPLMASRLGPLNEPFTADIMVDVLQTIGRAMRNGCPARVIFADAAWAPLSADGRGRDTGETSMLVKMRDILRARLADPDLVDREIYRALYEPFLHPLEGCEGVRFPDGADDDDE